MVLGRFSALYFSSPNSWLEIRKKHFKKIIVDINNKVHFFSLQPYLVLVHVASAQCFLAVRPGWCCSLMNFTNVNVEII